MPSTAHVTPPVEQQYPHRDTPRHGDEPGGRDENDLERGRPRVARHGAPEQAVGQDRFHADPKVPRRPRYGYGLANGPRRGCCLATSPRPSWAACFLPARLMLMREPGPGQRAGLPVGALVLTATGIALGLWCPFAKDKP
jgi:hypothetical protein